jgi:uncharacterized hydantoinase/oxoprolinase family protein
MVHSNQAPRVARRFCADFQALENSKFFDFQWEIHINLLEEMEQETLSFGKTIYNSRYFLEIHL